MSSPSLRSIGLGLLAAAGTVVTAAPCDIYGSGGTPCVAAHSTTRALYNNFSGALYQVQRTSDDKLMNISPAWQGGVANSAAQDAFCHGTNCYISVIYDQSGKGNHLTRAPPGGAASGPAANGYDNLANATAAAVHLNGHKVYGVSIVPGVGYRNNNAKGTATGNGAQGIYAVLDGTDYNSNCCFDYGNAETNSHDNGDAHMQALYFGTENTYGTGAGKGPWILADLENGLYTGDGTGANPNNPSITFRFVTGIVKGNTNNNWSVRGGNAAGGGLSTYYDGTRPNGYNPMKQEGAIILGTGGDNSDGAQGTFYEGIMTASYPSDATENSVQSNIVAAKYTT